MKQLMVTLMQLQTLEMGDERDTPSVSSTIEKLRKKIPPQVLGHYDRMLARGKKGVAIVRNGVCRACHMRVPLGVVQVLQHGSDIQLCGNCGRYLKLEETEPEPPPAPAPKRKKRTTKKAKVTDAA